MLRKILLIAVASLFIFGMSKLSFAMMCGDHSGSQQLAQAHSEQEHGTTEAKKDTATKESAVRRGVERELYNKTSANFAVLFLKYLWRQES